MLIYNQYEQELKVPDMNHSTIFRENLLKDYKFLIWSNAFDIFSSYAIVILFEDKELKLATFITLLSQETSILITRALSMLAPHRHATRRGPGTSIHMSLMSIQTPGTLFVQQLI